MRSPNASVGALRSLAAEAPLVIRVRGDCMAPGLPDGAAVEIAPARRYWPGDVVAFGSAPEQLTLHRVIGWRLKGQRLVVLTQADSGASADSPIVPAAIVGRVLGVVGANGALSALTPRRRLALRRWLSHLAAAVTRRLKRPGGSKGA